MRVDQVVPILNVADVPASIAWFAQLGWSTTFVWDADDPADPPGFAGVGHSGLEVFLCRDGQGGRGADAAWLAVWVDDVDALHDACRAAGLDVVRELRDEPWGVREFHLRHPDGHVLRVSAPSGGR